MHKKNHLKQHRVILLLGSNVGRREFHLTRAREELNSSKSHCAILKASPVYVTQPIGPSNKTYLNQALLIITTLSPMGLLVYLKCLEAQSGRKVTKRWSNRPLDIDIVTYDNLKTSTPWLTIPHPEMKKRAFALAPISDIAPHIKLSTNKSAQALLNALNPSTRIVRMRSHVHA